MRTLEGKLVSENGIKVGIVAARFNEFITSKLVGGALDGLKRENVKDEDIDVAWVPGAFEIPLIASKMAKSRKYDAIICVGAVIRGSTSHYDYVCSECQKALHRFHLPMIFRSCSESLPQIRLNRPLSALEPKPVIKDLNVRRVPLRW